MKNMIKLLAMLTPFALACAGANDATELDMPGQEGRIDGSVWDDGMFNSEQARADYCASDPGAWFCTGSNEQAFTVVEHYGVTQTIGGTCYSQNVPNNSDCLFPSKRKFRVVASNQGCFAGPPPPDGPSTLQEQAMLDGIRDGMLLWNGHGGIQVCLSTAAGCDAASSHTIRIGCNGPFGPDDLALGGLSGTYSLKTGNAPISGRTGVDVDDWGTATGSVIDLNAPRTLVEIHRYLSAPTVAQLQAFARYTGAHEGGHSIGFSHFGANGLVMNAFRPNTLNPAINITAAFDDALQQFNPTSSGIHLNNGTLWAQDPS